MGSSCELIYVSVPHLNDPYTHEHRHTEQLCIANVYGIRGKVERGEGRLYPSHTRFGWWRQQVTTLHDNVPSYPFGSMVYLERIIHYSIPYRYQYMHHVIHCAVMCTDADADSSNGVMHTVWVIHSINNNTIIQWYMS